MKIAICTFALCVCVAFSSGTQRETRGILSDKIETFRKMVNYYKSDEFQAKLHAFTNQLKGSTEKTVFCFLDAAKNISGDKETVAQLIRKAIDKAFNSDQDGRGSPLDILKNIVYGIGKLITDQTLFTELLEKSGKFNDAVKQAFVCLTEEMKLQLVEAKKILLETEQNTSGAGTAQ